jgi:hypothetical protein
MAYRGRKYVNSNLANNETKAEIPFDRRNAIYGLCLNLFLKNIQLYIIGKDIEHIKSRSLVTKVFGTTTNQTKPNQNRDKIKGHKRRKTPC